MPIGIPQMRFPDPTGEGNFSRGFGLGIAAQNQQRLKDLADREDAVREFHTLREILSDPDPQRRDALFDYWGTTKFGKDSKPQIDLFRKLIKDSDEQNIQFLEKAVGDLAGGVADGSISVRDAYGHFKNPLETYKFLRGRAVENQTKRLMTEPEPGMPEAQPAVEQLAGPPDEAPQMRQPSQEDRIAAMEKRAAFFRDRANKLVTIGAPKEAIEVTEKAAAAVESALTRLGETQTETIVGDDGNSYRIMFSKRSGTPIRVLGSAGKDTQIVQGTDDNGNPISVLVNKNNGDKIAEVTSQAAKYTSDADRVAGELYNKPFAQLEQAEKAAVNKRVQQDRVELSRQQGAAAIDLKNQQPVGTAAPTLINPKTMASPPTTMTKQQAIDAGYVEVPEKERAGLADLEQTRAIVKTIQTFADKLITAEGGLARSAQGTKLTAGALSGSDPAAATYQAQRQAFLGIISRTLGGERGVLTDRDITRIDAMLPGFFDSKTTKDLKIGLLNNMLQTAQEAKVALMTGQPITSGAAERIQQLLDAAEKANNASKRSAPKAAPKPGDVDAARSRLGLD